MKYETNYSHANSVARSVYRTWLRSRPGTARHGTARPGPTWQENGHAFTKLITFLNLKQLSAKLHVFPIKKESKEFIQRLLHALPKNFLGRNFQKTAPNPAYWIPVTTLFHRLPFSVLSLWNVINHSESCFHTLFSKLYSNLNFPFLYKVYMWIHIRLKCIQGKIQPEHI